MEGFIYLHRKLLNWEWKDDLVCLKVFIWCLLKANFKEKKWQGNTIEKGSFVTSIKHFSAELNITEMNLRTALKKLKKSENLTTKSTNKFTIISICNYEDYQTLETIKEQTKQQTNNKQITIKQQTNNKQITTTNNDNNVNKDNNDNKEDYLSIFDIFRKEYLKHNKSPRGNQTEFDNFKRHKDWKKEIHKLLPTLKSEILHRQANDKMKYMQNLKTWINNRQWEVDYGNTIDSIKPIIPKGIYEAMGTSMTKEEFLKMGKND
jgi:hypothetical protein